MYWSFSELSIVYDFPCGKCYNDCDYVYTLDLFDVCKSYKPGFEALPTEWYVEEHQSCIPIEKTKCMIQGDIIKYLEKNEDKYLAGQYDGPYKLREVKIVKTPIGCVFSFDEEFSIKLYGSLEFNLRMRMNLKTESEVHKLLHESAILKEKHQEMWRLVDIKNNLEINSNDNVASEIKKRYIAQYGPLKYSKN